MAKCLTLKQAKNLTHDDILYHQKHVNADGTAQRWRVSGKPKTWKKDPSRVRVPVKHGMYDNDSLTEDELCLVTLKEPAKAKKHKRGIRR